MEGGVFSCGTGLPHAELKRMCNKNGDQLEQACIYISCICLKVPLGWDIFYVVNFENLIYMKLYSLLILTENTKKAKNNFEAPKKSEIIVFQRSYIAM